MLHCSLQAGLPNDDHDATRIVVFFNGLLMKTCRLWIVDRRLKIEISHQVPWHSSNQRRAWIRQELDDICIPADENRVRERGLLRGQDAASSPYKYDYKSAEVLQHALPRMERAWCVRGIGMDVGIWEER